MKEARHLLRLMTKLYPPGENRNHSLTIQGQGLRLTLALEKEFLSFDLDEEDLGRPASVLTHEIQILMNAQPTPG